MSVCIVSQVVDNFKIFKVHMENRNIDQYDSMFF